MYCKNDFGSLQFLIALFFPPQNAWYLIGRKSSLRINIFINKHRRVLLTTVQTSHKNRLKEKLRLSSTDRLARGSCLQVLSEVKYCHLSDERRRSKVYSLVTFLPRIQTWAGPSPNGQEHRNIFSRATLLAFS